MSAVCVQRRLDEKRALKEFRRWISEKSYLSLFVTLVTNWDGTAARREWARLPPDPAVRVKAAFKALGHWDARVCRILNGKHWHRRRPHMRLMGFAFAEHVETNIHLHVVLQHHPEHDLEKLETAMKTAWKRICPIGDADVRKVPAAERQSVLRYVTKELKTDNISDRYAILPNPSADNG
jgi:hypothetical protein